MLVTFMFHLQSLRTKSLSLWVIVHNQCDFLRSSVSFTVIFCCPEVILQWQDVCRRTSVNLNVTDAEPLKVSQTSWSTMWTFESSDFVDTYLQRGLCHTFISDLKLITISFQVHVYHHKTLFNLGSLLGGSRPVFLAGVSTFAPLNEHSSEISVAGEWVTWLALIVFIALSRSRSLFPTSF